jgi:hypothetical protein
MSYLLPTFSPAPVMGRNCCDAPQRRSQERQADQKIFNSAYNEFRPLTMPSLDPNWQRNRQSAGDASEPGRAARQL